MEKNDIKKIVKDKYGNIAKDSSCCCQCGSKDISQEEIAKQIGYSDNDLEAIPDANLGLGCGNPTAILKSEDLAIFC